MRKLAALICLLLLCGGIIAVAGCDSGSARSPSGTSVENAATCPSSGACSECRCNGNCEDCAAKDTCPDSVVNSDANPGQCPGHDACDNHDACPHQETHNCQCR